MPFNGVFGMENFSEQGYSLITRQAVRAVIFRNGKILTIRSERGDYKLPGGGIEKMESHEEALLREVAEETGYLGCSIIESIGTVTERYIDAYEPDTYFEMVSHYYKCEMAELIQGPLRLSAQELEQNFQPVWTGLDEAISTNHKILLQNSANRWIRRENFVLMELKKCMAN